MAGVAAACFACILTLIALQRSDPTAEHAMIAFCIALPLALGHWLVTSVPVRKFHMSFLHKVLSLLAIFAFVIGLAILISTVSQIGATVIIALPVAMSLIIENAERRAKKKAAKKPTTDVVPSDNSSRSPS